jgi:hypothetical protein
MTVAELALILTKYDPNAIVFIMAEAGCVGGEPTIDNINFEPEHMYEGRKIPAQLIIDI